MDVGEVQHKHDYGTYDDEEEGGDEVGAVSANTQCHGCGGWGHMKRECPTALANKGKGKGKGKGPSPEWGKGGAS
jgi:hypothetical protein